MGETLGIESIGVYIGQIEVERIVTDPVSQGVELTTLTIAADVQRSCRIKDILIINPAALLLAIHHFGIGGHIVWLIKVGRSQYQHLVVLFKNPVTGNAFIVTGRGPLEGTAGIECHAHKGGCARTFTVIAIFYIDIVDRLAREAGRIEGGSLCGRFNGHGSGIHTFEGFLTVVVAGIHVHIQPHICLLHSIGRTIAGTH